MLLKAQVNPQDFLNSLADCDLNSAALQFWKPLKEQNALDQLIRMLHLVNGLRVFACPA